MSFKTLHVKQLTVKDKNGNEYNVGDVLSSLTSGQDLYTPKMNNESNEDCKCTCNKIIDPSVIKDIDNNKLIPGTTLVWNGKFFEAGLLLKTEETVEEIVVQNAKR